MKNNYTREEVILVIEEILQMGDLFMDAILSNDPDTGAEDFLNLADNSLVRRMENETAESEMLAYFHKVNTDLHPVTLEPLDTE